MPAKTAQSADTFDRPSQHDTAASWDAAMKFPAFMLVVLCGVLWFAADSHAFAPASSPYIERYERIATSYWGDVPDCEQVEYLWPAEDPFGNDDALAYADIGGCRMWLVYWEPLRGASLDRWEAYAFNCSTFVHEWGHLVGFDHDAEGFRSGRLYDVCDRAAARRYSNARVAKVKRKPRRAIRDFNDSGPNGDHGD